MSVKFGAELNASWAGLVEILKFWQYCPLCTHITTVRIAYIVDFGLVYLRIGGSIVNGAEMVLFVTTSRSAVETNMGAKDQGLELTTYF